PERLLGRPASKASDWYSLGAILREVLPSARSGAHEDAAQAEIAATLAMICERLLCADPAERPDAGWLRATLGLRKTPESEVRRRDSKRVWVGRERELSLLHAAFEQARRTRRVVVALHGEPGIGKSALAKRFLGDLRERDAAIVLSARCHEG